MRTYKWLGLALATVLLTPMAASARINHYYDNPQNRYYVPGNQGVVYRDNGHGRGHGHGRHDDRNRNYYPVRERVVYYEPRPPRRLYRPVYSYPYYFGPQPGVNLNVNFR